MDEGPSLFEAKRRRLGQVMPARITGRVTRVVGLVVETTPLPVPVGSLCVIQPRVGGEPLDAEVVGFREDASLLMPLAEMRGIGPGDRVACVATEQVVPVGPGLLGRVLDGLGRPMDGKGPVVCGSVYPVYANPPDAVLRPRISEPLGTGVRAIDEFLTVGRGQRIGIMAGTGVGKSVLLGMLAKYARSEVAVVSLVGERGREVNDFIERDLGPEGMARSVVVCATSDQPAPVRVKAPFVATAVAEFFRDQGHDVTLLMDTVTRMAMAQRDIGGSVGEVAAMKGYTPSVFAMIPRLMERAGRGPRGAITGFYTVLVEGDDMNEPIADTTRGVLDGHIVLSRKLGQRGHFPAIDIPQSISRCQPEVVDQAHIEHSRRLREMLSLYQENEDMINLGAVPWGVNPELDRARAVNPALIQFLRQDRADNTPLEETAKRAAELAAASRQDVRPPAPAGRPPPQGRQAPPR